MIDTATVQQRFRAIAEQLRSIDQEIHQLAVELPEPATYNAELFQDDEEQSAATCVLSLLRSWSHDGSPLGDATGQLEHSARHREPQHARR